jgi:hypothetical protein
MGWGRNSPSDGEGPKKGCNSFDFECKNRLMRNPPPAAPHKSGRFSTADQQYNAIHGGN